MQLRDRLIIYLAKKNNRLESEREDLRLNTRWRPVDSLDLYEIMRESVRLECWKEFTDDLYRIVLNDVPLK